MCSKLQLNISINPLTRLYRWDSKRRNNTFWVSRLFVSLERSWSSKISAISCRLILWTLFSRRMYGLILKSEQLELQGNYVSTLYQYFMEWTVESQQVWQIFDNWKLRSQNSQRPPTKMECNYHQSTRTCPLYMLFLLKAPTWLLLVCHLSSTSTVADARGLVILRRPTW